MRCLRFAPLLVVGGLLSACADQHAEDAARAQTALVGMPKQTLLSCAGVPDRTATSGAAEYYTYVSRSYGSSGFTPSIGIGGGGFGGSGGGFGGGGIGLGFPLSSGSGEPPCQATFTVQNGVVTQLVYTGGPTSSQCYSIVQNCLARVPAPVPPR